MQLSDRVLRGLAAAGVMSLQALALADIEPANDAFATAEFIDVSGGSFLAALNDRGQRSCLCGDYTDAPAAILRALAPFGGGPVAQDYSSSPYGVGHAPALYGMPAGDPEWSSGVLLLTGWPNGDFLPGFHHGQLGRWRLYVTLRDWAGEVVSETFYEGEFVTGSELHEFTMAAPGVDSYDAELDNCPTGSCGSPVVCAPGDRDFFILAGLEPGVQYAVRTTRTPNSVADTVLAALDEHGGVIVINDNEPGTGNTLSKISAIADANGRIRIAVSGWPDFDFDGLADGGDCPHQRIDGYGVSVEAEEPACAADRNGDGQATVADLIAYLTAFAAGDADMNGDAQTTVADLIAYLTAFGAGCA